MNQPKIADLSAKQLFVNRELSFLEFNRRVKAQARDERVPLLERLRFLTIVSSNLDEFFEVRVGLLKQRIALALPHQGADGGQEALAVRGPVVRRGARAGHRRGRVDLLLLWHHQSRFLRGLALSR